MIAAVRPRKRVHQNSPARTDRLVNENIGLAFYFARKYHASIDRDQAKSLAMAGLLDAAKTYRKKMGKFALWAGWHIANRLNWQVKSQRRVKRGGEDVTISLDDDRSVDNGWHETITDPRTQDPASAIVHSDKLQAVVHCIERMDPRDQQIIKARFGLSGKPPMFLREVGKIVGRCHESVRQDEQRILASMRSSLQRV